MLERIPGWIFVVGVSLLIATIAYSSQLFIFLPALGGWNAESLKLLGPFNVLVLLVYYNYFLACSTDPGRVPVGWEPPYSTFAPNQDDSGGNNDVAGKKRWRQSDMRATDTGMTGPRFCKSCKTYKPPRTHHCRYCRRCVLKMDHHCPWISNCVGNDNYGHFVRFVLYVDIACGYALGLLIWRVRRIMDDIRHFRFQAEPSTTEVIFLVLNFILAFIVIFCVGVLSVYHLYCMSKNQSSIESWERSKVKSLIRRGKILPVNYPYDVGLYRNICAVLGSNPLLWMVPQRCVGDGLTFPVRPGTDPRLPYCWPPRDPDDLRPSIFSSRYKRQQEKELRRTRRAPHLVRRDSEGYLVREITLEDRMRMLNNMQTESEPLETLDNDSISDDEIDSVEDYYDSGSYITDSDAEVETEQMFEERTQWMQDRVMDLSGGTDEDYYEYDANAWDNGEQGILSERQHLMHHHHHHQTETSDDYYDSDDGVPLAAYQQKLSKAPVSGKASKED